MLKPQRNSYAIIVSNDKIEHAFDLGTFLHLKLNDSFQQVHSFLWSWIEVAYGKIPPVFPASVCKSG